MPGGWTAHQGEDGGCRTAGLVLSSERAKMAIVTTELLYLRDAYLRDFDATVTSVDEGGRRVSLDQTIFYPTGGGQPHDTGSLGGLRVVGVQKEDDEVWHTLDGDCPLPAGGDTAHGEIDWERRHQLMRTHTALHVLCGVIWNEWGTAVTGGNMEPLSARMDFEFDPLPPGFGETVEKLVNAEIPAARPIEVSFTPRSEAVLDEELIRTKDWVRNMDAARRERVARFYGAAAVVDRLFEMDGEPV